MKFVYPTLDDIDKIRKLAREYAEMSFDYTKDFKGWEQESDDDRQKKIDRIIIGRMGQLWLRRLCDLNYIPAADELSDSKTADSYDVSIGGYRFDTKITRNGTIVGQVNESLRDKDIHYFCFLKTTCYEIDKTLIESYGVIRAKDYWKHCQHIAQDEIIPGTHFINNFECGTNVIDKSHLKPLEYVLTLISKKRTMEFVEPELKKLENRLKKIEQIVMQPPSNGWESEQLAIDWTGRE